MKKVFRRIFRQNHLFLWGPVVVCYGLISFVSSLPSSSFHFSLGRFDKAVHFLEFGLFGSLTARALFWERLYHHVRKNGWIIGGGIISVLAMIDEVHQMFVPGRTSEVMDWLADVGGAAFGMIVCRAIYHRSVDDHSFSKI